MFLVDYILLIAGILLLIGVLASKLASHVGLPVLVLFIGVGMLAGVDGIGRIDFDNYSAAHAIGTVALCLILFDGGLRTSVASLRRVWKPAGILATGGVMITSLLTGLAAWWIMDLSLIEALLLGSIVGSTDAAAVFSIFRSKGLSLDSRLTATLEVESGSNDPMAIFLTVGLLEILSRGESSAAGWFLLLLQQMGIGLLIGFVCGWLSVLLINRIRLDAAGLYPVLSGSCCVLAFGGAATLGGSGFLAVYVAGIWIGHRRTVYQRGSLLFLDGLAWFGQIAMFVVLGLLCTPRELLQVIVPGALIALVLIFVARPVAVFLLMPWFKFRFRELLFLSWVGLKGAVPIVLATYPLLFGIEGAALLFNVVFFVVLVSAVTQGWSLPVVARWLGLQKPFKARPPVALDLNALHEVDTEIAQYELAPSSAATGRSVNQLALPDGVVIAVIARESRLMPPRGSTRLAAGDHVFVILKPEMRPLVELAFADRAAERMPELPLVAEFIFPVTVRIGHLRAMYGIDLELSSELRLDDAVRQLLGDDVRPGTIVERGSYMLHVREMEGQRILTIGLVRQLPQSATTATDGADQSARPD